MIQDLRYTIRQLRKNPAFAVTVILVLALGIAGTVSIFGFVDASLIKPLPYRDQSRLVAVFDASKGDPRSLTSYPDFADWKRLNHVFSSIDAYALNGSFTLRTSAGAEQVPGTRVSAGFFRTLGVAPLLGRDFRLDEDSPASARPVIISYAAWQKRYRGSRDVLGRTLTLNGQPVTIVGVLPATFHFAPYGRAEFWGTDRSTDSCEQHRNCKNLIAIARLKEGVSLETASADMRSIARRLQKQYPDSDSEFDSATVLPLREVIVGDIRPILLVLLSGAGLLLLIACANVITLLLARSDKRQREIAVRNALGASSWRLFIQFAMEGLVFASLSGALALIAARLGMQFLTNLIPAEKMESMPYLRDIGLSSASVLFTCSLSLMAGLLFATIPIARLKLEEMVEGLKEGDRSSSGTTWRRMGSKLVAAEIALALVLMTGGALLYRSLYALLHVDVGFSPNHLVSVQTSWAPGNYDNDKEVVALGRKMLVAVSSLPGVQSAALTVTPPIDSDWLTTSFHVTGRPNHGEINEVLNRPVTSGFFTTLGARLLRGRYFHEDEDVSKPRVAIVNRTLANKYFAGEDPIGKQIYYDWSPHVMVEIVGLVDDIKEGALAGASTPVLYSPYDQNPVAWPAVMVRTFGAEADVSNKLAPAIHQIDPFITVSDAQTMTQRIEQSPAAYLDRSSAVLAGFFASTAFFLSMIGLYGVIAYSVSQRTREIGVRMALGAERGAVYRLILQQAWRLAAVGVICGFLCSLGTARLLRALLFGIGSSDMLTITGVAIVLGISALLASHIPARRAASVNPVEALRSE